MVPKRNCVKKEFLKLKGTSLSKWVQEPKHLYIHGNLSKYLKRKGTPNSIWYKRSKNYKHLQMGKRFACLQPMKDVSDKHLSCGIN